MTPVGAQKPQQPVGETRVLAGGRTSHLRGTWVGVEDERGIDISCSDELQRLKIAIQF